MDSITGTYYGVLPSDVETTLTLNADGTYLLIRTFKEKQNEQEKLNPNRSLGFLCVVRQREIL